MSNVFLRVALASLLIGLPTAYMQPALADDAYPHITALEKAILGLTYGTESLTARLSRMETRAFGKASKDNDLSQRTDDLEDYAVKTLHQKPWGAGSAYDLEQQEAAGTSAANPTYVDADTGEKLEKQSAPVTEYPHVTALEKSILEQTYPGQPLPDRLARMETKAFGSVSANKDLSDRTDALEEYAQKKLHKKGFVQEQQREAEAHGGMPADGGAGKSGGADKSGAGGQSKMANFVGNTLLNMAGSALMPGFGGVRMRQRGAQDAPQAKAAAEVRPDDPAVNDPTPPPAGTKMLTQVGWCEVQLFGHTFGTLHLPDRLQQLNKELSYAPSKTPLALMDDMAGLIKAVQAKKATPAK